jgi:hypothetical protein
MLFASYPLSVDGISQCLTAIGDTTMLKRTILSLFALVVMSGVVVAPASAQYDHHHHRHEVCTWHHHHKVCHWE